MKKFILSLSLALVLSSTAATAGENKDNVEKSNQKSNTKSVTNIALGTMITGSALTTLHLTNREVRLLKSDVRGNERLLLDKIIGIDSLKKSRSKLATAKLVRNVAFLPNVFWTLEGIARMASGMTSDRDLGLFVVDDLVRIGADKISDRVEAKREATRELAEEETPDAAVVLK